MEQLSNIVKCLTIICLNTFNIPMVASMDFVSHITQLNNLLLQQLMEMESTFFSNKVHSAVSTNNLRTSIIGMLQFSRFAIPHVGAGTKATYGA